MDKEKKKFIPKVPPSWKNKLIDAKEVGPEPPLNKEGFWKKYEPQDFEISGVEE